jgi:ATP-dependent helicase/nuclease subunit A
VIDVAIFTDTGIWLLDFKTDAVTETTLPEKIRAYTPQLNLYALALARIHQRPVTEAWLYFLAANHSAPVPLEQCASAS